MKQTMLFAIMALVAIVIASSFGLQLSPHPAVSIPDSAAANALYLCRAASPTWDAVAAALAPFVKYITVAFFFVVMLLMFNWGWALYQNLLSDSFKRESFSNPWKYTKVTFWAAVVVLLLAATPNYFRSVHVNGVSGDWVLCDANTPGARAFRANAVTR